MSAKYSSKNLLVAEDSDVDIFLLKRAFLKAGVNCPLHFVKDGAAAISYLSGEGHFGDRKEFPVPHLVILDIKMPGADGFEVLQWLRKQPNIGLLPVIMLSSSNFPSDVDKAHALGANGYNVKPVDTDALEALIRGIECYWLKQHQYPSAAVCV